MPTMALPETSGRCSRVYQAVERYWHKMLCSRSRAGHIPWDVFHRIKERYPATATKAGASLMRELQAIAVL